MTEKFKKLIALTILAVISSGVIYYSNSDDRAVIEKRDAYDLRAAKTALSKWTDTNGNTFFLNVDNFIIEKVYSEKESYPAIYTLDGFYNNIVHLRIYIHERNGEYEMEYAQRDMNHPHKQTLKIISSKYTIKNKNTDFTAGLLKGQLIPLSKQVNHKEATEFNLSYLEANDNWLRVDNDQPANLAFRLINKVHWNNETEACFDARMIPTGSNVKMSIPVHIKVWSEQRNGRHYYKLNYTIIDYGDTTHDPYMVHHDINRFVYQYY